MSVRITQQQLESYLWGAAVLLRGTIDAGDYKQFIFPLLFYKRLCDVFDEETQTALAELAHTLDLRVEVVDDRAEYVTRERFPHARPSPRRRVHRSCRERVA